MAAHYRIRTASIEDMEYLSTISREADVEELWASARVSPREAMMRGREVSDMTCVVEIDGKPVCMFGVVRHAEDTGISWMIGSTEIEKHKASFFKASQEGIQQMLKLFPVLVNYVDVRHGQAIQWLKRLGAQFQEPTPYGVDGLPFSFFEIRG